GIALIDPDSLTQIKGAKIPEEGNNNHSFFIQNFDFIDTSQIFFGAFSMWVEYFGVSKVNSNMEPYWLKYFSRDDDVQHVVWSVVATSDGGCVMTGGKGSYNLSTG
ncbi:hypothetical protein RZS08_57910, partial [Arthrospira platensis SPKY1]|nr:hypothetical protein [Arthrospira platensis SPKY1]